MTLTPEQFNKLATKEDLKEFLKKEEFEEAKSEILGAVDAVMHKLDDIEHAFVSNQAAHDRFETRLQRIEKHLGLKVLLNR